MKCSISALKEKNPRAPASMMGTSPKEIVFPCSLILHSKDKQEQAHLAFLSVMSVVPIPPFLKLGDTKWNKLCKFII